MSLILISHGHDDHLGDAAAVSRATGAPIVCLFEIGEYLREKGLQGVRDTWGSGCRRQRIDNGLYRLK